MLNLTHRTTKVEYKRRIILENIMEIYEKGDINEFEDDFINWDFADDENCAIKEYNHNVFQELDGEERDELAYSLKNEFSEIQARILNGEELNSMDIYGYIYK